MVRLDWVPLSPNRKPNAVELVGGVDVKKVVKFVMFIFPSIIGRLVCRPIIEDYSYFMGVCQGVSVCVLVFLLKFGWRFMDKVFVWMMVKA